VRSRVFIANMTASGSADQWFYPGDLGWRTGNDVLCIAGRAGDVVNRGGEKLDITDVEKFLLTCPGVKDAGACTHVGPTGITQVWATLVLAPNSEIAAIRFAIESSSHYRNNIDKIFVIESIPRGTLGKIQRDELKRMLDDAQGIERPPN
jgi:acyl-coenzyme A synthetase/AMP-(fatty) acid ligase